MSSEPGGGFKAFNATGRDDVTTEILRPKTDSATLVKRVVGVAIVVVLLVVICIVAFQRSGIKFDDGGSKPGFGPPQQQGG